MIMFIWKINQEKINKKKGILNFCSQKKFPISYENLCNQIEECDHMVDENVLNCAQNSENEIDLVPQVCWIFLLFIQFLNNWKIFI